jgi:hypothetical protein
MNTHFLNWPTLLTQLAAIMLSAAVLKYLHISINDYDLSYLQCCIMAYLMYLICTLQQALTDIYYRFYYKYIVPARRVMPIVPPPTMASAQVDEELKRAANSYKP